MLDRIDPAHRFFSGLFFDHVGDYSRCPCDHENAVQCRRLHSAIAPPWWRLIDMIPAATAALSEAPVEAVVRAANALGGVAPWSIDETRIASINRPTDSDGNSPVNIKYTAAAKETRPINSAMS